MEEHDSDWSDDTLTIREVVTQEELPLMVKVTEGLYGEDEAESFSQGDIIKLDCVMDVDRVVSYRKESEFQELKNPEDEDYIPPNRKVFIPLKYKGKLNIIHKLAGQRVFNSVAEMIQYFPRFVSVVQGAIDMLTGSPVPGGTQLELDRVIPDKGLVCLSKQTKKSQLLLNPKGKGQFLLLPDTTKYTIQNVIEQFPLPQTVEFLSTETPQVETSNINTAVENARIFRGSYELRDHKTQTIIIGHSKPYLIKPNKSKTAKPPPLPPGKHGQRWKDRLPLPLPAKEQPKMDGNTERRTMVIIPMNSLTATDIEVQTYQPEDIADYEMVMSRNFSKDLSKDESLGGTVYMYLSRADLSKVVRIQDSSASSQSDTPTATSFQPYRPPKRSKSPPGSQRPQGTNTNAKVSDVPPPRPPRKKSVQETRRTVSNAPILPRSPTYTKANSDDKDSDYYYMGGKAQPASVNDDESGDDNDAYEKINEDNVYDVIIDESVVNTRALTDDEKAGGYVTVDRKHSIREDVIRQATMDQVGTKRDSQVSFQNFRLRLESVKKELLNKVQKIKKPQALVSRLQPVGDKDIKIKHKITTSPKSPINVNKPLSVKRPDSPVYEICDKTEYSKGHFSPDLKKHDYSDLSVTELCSKLKIMEMPRAFVKQCENEKLDGQFFTAVPDDVLQSTFKLKAIDIMKLNRLLKDGWEPKLSH